MNKAHWISLVLGTFLALAAGVTYAQDAIAITQIDPSKFPQMGVYIDAEASKLPAGLTKDNFQVTEDGQPVEIIDFAGKGEPRPVDIVFVIDTTGSMREEIDGVINTCIAFANKLRANNRDFRLGLVAFGDEIRVVRNTDKRLTADADEFKSWVTELNADGGDDEPEIALDGLEQATTMQFRDTAQKVLILITDAPPHEQGDGTTFSHVSPTTLPATLHKEGFVVYAVAYNHPDYHAIVTTTGGKFYELTPGADFTNIIDEIGGDIAKQYRLTYKSPRASYDGTRRNIVIKVGEKTGKEFFVEKHLINLQSSPLIGLLLLLPLLVGLFVPMALDKRKKPRSEPVFTYDPPLAFTPEPILRDKAADVNPFVPPAIGPPGNSSPTMARCPHCGHELRPGAQFCGHCGQTTTVFAGRPQQPVCPTCGQNVRIDAKFCGKCGQKM